MKHERRPWESVSAPRSKDEPLRTSSRYALLQRCYRTGDLNGKALSARTPVLGSIPRAPSSCLTIGLFIYFPTTRTLLPLHSDFIIALMPGPRGEARTAQVHSAVCPTPHLMGLREPPQNHSLFLSHLSFPCPFFSEGRIFWCVFQM